MRQIREIQASDGYPLRYYVWDAPEAAHVVFFIHGFMSHTLWVQPQLNTLRRLGYKVVGIERRGAGINRLHLGDAPSAQQLLDDHELVIACEGKEKKIHIWGWCLGGVIALNYISHTKQHLTSLMLAAPSIFPQEHLVERAKRIGAHPVGPCTAVELPLAICEEDFTKGPQLKSFILKDTLRTNRVSYRFYEIQRKLSQAAWVSALKGTLQLPTLLILGSQDVIVDNVRTESVFKPLRACQITHIDAGHGIQFEKGDELTTALTNWLDRFHGDHL